MYNRLLEHCWLEISLPNDLNYLKGLCKGKKPSSKVIALFYKEEGTGRLRSKRLDEEREKQNDRHRRMSEAGKRGNEKRWGSRRTAPEDREAIEERSLSDRGAIADQRSGQVALQFPSPIGDTKSPPPPISPPRGDCPTGKRMNGHCQGCLEAWTQFWRNYPRHEPGQMEVMGCWCKLWKKNEIPPIEIILSWIKEANKSKQWQDPSSIPHAKTFVNRKRWTGDPPPIVKKVFVEPGQPTIEEEKYKCSRCRDTGRLAIIRNKADKIHAIIFWSEYIEGERCEIRRCICGEGDKYEALEPIGEVEL